MDNTELLQDFFLFKGIDTHSIEKLLSKSSPKILDYSRGDLIYSPRQFEKNIGLILEGKCEVKHSRADGTGIVINTLRPGDSFGVLAAFSENEFPTEIVAAKSSRVLFFGIEDVVSFVKSNGDIAMNLISFMAGRIEFLNEKIITISGGSIEQKLASYLLTEAKQKGERFDFNRKKTAETISASRVSVYRALDSFVKLGILNYDSKKIYIIDRIGLERISK